MSAGGKVVSARVRPQIRDRLDELSARSGVPLSTIIELLLARALGFEEDDARARVLRALEGGGS